MKYTNIAVLVTYFSSSALSLEKHRFLMSTFGADVIFSSRKSWVVNDIRNNLGQFTKKH